MWLTDTPGGAAETTCARQRVNRTNRTRDTVVGTVDTDE